jgi:heme/copper-type cytochrome/quinol oxidase subunit 3
MMSTDAMSATLSDVALPHRAHGSRAFGWWGMVLLIATEAMLFSALIASYFFLRFQHGTVWPPGDIEKPALGLAVVMSVILWSSSIPVHIAAAGIEKGSQARLRWGMLGGFILGLVFLLMTLGIEWPEKLDEFTPATNVYGSLFFTITGFHASHVAVGLIFSIWTQVRAWKGVFTEDRHLTVQNFALYWHFVDAVWVAVFLTIYISPNF